MYRMNRVHVIEYLVHVYEKEQEDDTTLQSIFPDFSLYKEKEISYARGHHFESKKECVERWFSHFRKVFYHTDEPVMKRVNAKVIMELIRNIKFIYEDGIELDEEEIDDMFLAYDERFRPVFPENFKEIMEKLKRR